MKKAIRYSIVVCLISWAAAAVARFGFGMDRVNTPMFFTTFATFYMFLPMITALILQAIDKEKFNHTGLVNFKVSWPWLVAWLLPVLMSLACIPINSWLPGVELQYNSEQLINQYQVPEDQQELVREQLGNMPSYLLVISTIFSGLIAGITINAIAAFGEEYGWRNYLVGALREVKFWKAALFIGIVWGIWHFPLILMGHNYPNEPRWGVPLMVVMCVLSGVIELYFVLKSKSMIVAAIMHGTFNAVSGLVIYFVLGGNDFLNGMTGLAGFIVMAITILCIWIYEKSIAKENIFGMTLDEALARPLDRVVPRDDAKRVPSLASKKERD